MQFEKNRPFFQKAQIWRILPAHTQTHTQIYYVLDKPPAGWTGGSGYVTKEMLQKEMYKPDEDTMVSEEGGDFTKNVNFKRLDQKILVFENLYIFPSPSSPEPASLLKIILDVVSICNYRMHHLVLSIWVSKVHNNKQILWKKQFS